MQAIRTRYIGPTDFRGSRVKASAEAGSLTLPWDYALDSGENHAAAAAALCRKMGWTNRLVSGVWGGDYYHTMVPKGE